MKKIVALTAGLSIVVSSLLAGSVADIKLDPIIENIVSGKRIIVKADIEDKAGIDVARTYFKSADGANYSFVPMSCKKTACSGILPAPSASTKSIDYLVLVKNANNVVYKTQTFNATTLPEKSKTPAYQIDPTDKVIHVKTELAKAPKMVEGFSDNVAMDTVDSTLRFGAVAGISSISTGGATAGGAAAASATTGTVAGGTVVATGVGISTTALVVGGAVAVAAGGAAAASGGSSSGGSYVAVPTDPDEEDLQGASGDPRVNLSWDNSADLDLYVTDPCGNEIDYHNKLATCNGYEGTLDVDANVREVVANPQENITWTSGGSTGAYKVRLVDYNNRSNGITSYTITIINNDATTKYTGTVNAGGSKDITTFTH